MRFEEPIRGTRHTVWTETALRKRKKKRDRDDKDPEKETKTTSPLNKGKQGA